MLWLSFSSKDLPVKNRPKPSSNKQELSHYRGPWFSWQNNHGDICWEDNLFWFKQSRRFLESNGDSILWHVLMGYLGKVLQFTSFLWSKGAVAGVSKPMAGLAAGVELKVVRKEQETRSRLNTLFFGREDLAHSGNGQIESYWLLSGQKGLRIVGLFLKAVCSGIMLSQSPRKRPGVVGGQGEYSLGVPVESNAKRNTGFP